MKITALKQMQKFDHKCLIYGIIGTQEQVLFKQGKQAIRVQAIEVLLYFILKHRL